MNTFHEYKRNNMDVDWCFKNFLNYRHLKAADDVREQLQQIMNKVGISVKPTIPIQSNVVAIKKCLLTGYFTQIAIIQKNNVYLTCNYFLYFSERFTGCSDSSQLCNDIQTIICSIS